MNIYILTGVCFYSTILVLQQSCKTEQQTFYFVLSGEKNKFSLHIKIRIQLKPHNYKIVPVMQEIVTARPENLILVVKGSRRRVPASNGWTSHIGYTRYFRKCKTKQKSLFFSVSVYPQLSKNYIKIVVKKYKIYLILLFM